MSSSAIMQQCAMLIIVYNNYTHSKYIRYHQSNVDSKRTMILLHFISFCERIFIKMEFSYTTFEKTAGIKLHFAYHKYLSKMSTERYQTCFRKYLNTVRSQL